MWKPLTVKEIKKRNDKEGWTDCTCKNKDKEGWKDWTCSSWFCLSPRGTPWRRQSRSSSGSRQTRFLSFYCVKNRVCVCVSVCNCVFLSGCDDVIMGHDKKIQWRWKWNITHRSSSGSRQTRYLSFYCVNVCLQLCSLIRVWTKSGQVYKFALSKMLFAGYKRLHWQSD